MYILSANMWFQTLMRQFFFNIDKIVFNFISIVYDLLISIARTSVLSQADIIDMADRIYKLLAIFMIFKVTFSLIMYVVNPDDFSDKTKGVSKLGTNIIISLALLILTPYIFSYAYQLQTIILEDNSLASLVFGSSGEENKFLNTAGEDMAFITMRPFFMPNTSIVSLTDCIELNDACFDAMSEETDDSKFTSTMVANYRAGISASNLGLTFRQDLAIATIDDGGETYVMDYKYLFSTVVGVIVIVLLVTFCMDVAVRSIKLAFLQLIAPIPIISYVDPKSGKDGLFKKWYQMCFKTYLSLFIRLLALYFAVYIISRLGGMVDIVDGSQQTNAFVAIFIIIGALMFAKQLPKILEGLGIKLDGGGFTLNPLKKIENEALGGKQISKAAKVPLKYGARAAKGLATAGAVGGAAFLTGQGLRGMGKAFAGAMKGEKFGKNFSNSYKAAHDRKRQVAQMRADGVSPSQVGMENFKNKFRGETTAEKVGQVESKAKAIQSYYDNIKNQAIACDSNDNSYIYDANGNRVQTKSAKTLSKELEEMKKTQISRESFHDIEGKTAQDQYNEAVETHNTKIADLQSKKIEYQNKNSEINLQKTKLKSERDNLDRSNYSSDVEYYEAQAAYTQQIASLEEQQRSYDVASLDTQIVSETAQRDALSLDQFEDIEEVSADEQYNEAINTQREAIKQKEAEIEERVNSLANNEVHYIDSNGDEQTGTGVSSADKVISESKEAMLNLVEDVNKVGSKIDDKFEKIDIMYTASGGKDIVKLMKQSRGAVAQTTSGKMSDIKDVAKYTKQKKS